jgi:YidC/Oxa1 family membrane protein insertase
MNSEARFVLAVVLMIGVLIGTNMLFAPPPPVVDSVTEPVRSEEAGMGEAVGHGDVTEVAEADTGSADPLAGVAVREEASGEAGPRLEGVLDPGITEGTASPARVSVSSGLYRYTFSTQGAQLVSAQLSGWASFTREGAVELVGEGASLLGTRLVVGADTVDLRRVVFDVEPAAGLSIGGGDGPQTLVFTYRHPDRPFGLEVRYTFEPDSYVIRAQGRVRGLDRALVLTDLGRGLAYNEVDPRDESRAMAFATNHLQNGITSRELLKVDRVGVEEGPFHWVAVRSRYFVMALLPSEVPAVEGGSDYLGGLLVTPTLEVSSEGFRDASFGVSHSLTGAGTFAYRLFAGPQDYQLLSALGNDLQEVNPVGWKFLRPLLKPFVAGIMWVLVYLHTNLALGYGWVLIVFGVMMRVVLFPLYHKAMRAQLRNMAVQPLLKDIQTRYKDNPERMQKELMKLYKEHGFNPLAGCWPMLLPWPILIALFFVFQNTIELRGVPFGWLPDLSAKDPLFILPVLLGVSMFFLQWISIRVLDEVQPQMKMLMYVLPVVMVVIFANFPSGLNLYYLTANVATLPQSWWIANERQKMQAANAKNPKKLEDA